MSVYLSMKLSSKIYTCIYWVHACILLQLIFVLIERGHTCTYSYVWVHTMCNCFVPACALLARLHPAGLPAPYNRAAHLKAAHSLQQQETLVQEQISLLLCRQLQGSPKAASSAVMTLKSLHKSKQLYCSQSAFKRSTIIEEHQNWSCVAGQKLKFRECYGFPTVWHHLVFSRHIVSIRLSSNQQILLYSSTHVYWEPSFSKTMSNENS